eukprot:6200498-Pleurochrysis_carterae.AAC.3
MRFRRIVRVVKRRCASTWAQGTCVLAGFVPFLSKRMGQIVVRACEAAAAIFSGTLGRQLVQPPRRMARCP